MNTEIKFFAGQEFSSAQEMHAIFQAYQTQNNVIFTKARSELLDGKHEHGLVYKSVTFNCKFFGEPRAQKVGKNDPRKTRQSRYLNKEIIAIPVSKRNSANRFDML